MKGRFQEKLEHTKGSQRKGWQSALLHMLCTQYLGLTELPIS